MEHNHQDEKLNKLKIAIGYFLTNSQKCELALWIMGDVRDSLDFQQEEMAGIVDKEIPTIPF